MRKTKLTKLPAKMFVLGLCIAGLVFVGSTRTVSVKATSCDDAYNAYYAADNAYDTARISFFYNSPETCAQECRRKHPVDAIHDPNDDAYNQCVADCPTNRETTLAADDSDLVGKALETCTPASPDACDAARAAAAACYDQYDYLDYSDLNERLAVYEQYSACQLATKADACQ